MLRQDEVAQVTGITLPEDEEYETVGGLALDLFEQVPRVGDNTEVEAYIEDGQPVTAVLTVLEMEGRRIDRMKLSFKI